MRTICELDAAGVWTGNSRQIADDEGRPANWPVAGRPDVPPGKVALWADPGWSIIEPSDVAQPALIILAAPDNPTLGDWRVAVLLWGRLGDVLARIEALVAAGHPLGTVARERVEYSNNVMRDQLMQLKDALGFSVEDVEESLGRAHRVSLGDLSGVWP